MQGDEEIRQAKNMAVCDQVIKHHLLGLMPNIARTGIPDIDEPKNDASDPFASFSLQKLNIFQDKKPENFKSYAQGTAVLDLDGYYSASL